MKSTRTLILSLVILLVTGCSGNFSDINESGSGLTPSRESTSLSVGSEMEKLQYLNQAYENYHADTDVGINWRRFRAAFTRRQVFEAALSHYWYIYDKLPDAVDVEGSVNMLEEARLLPFWPADPETGTPVEIVGTTDEVTGYRQVCIILAENRGYDYYMSMYDQLSPDIPESFRMFYEAEDRNDVSRTISIPVPEGARHDGPIEVTFSYDPSDNFLDVIMTLYMTMIQESFLESDCVLPETLADLLGNRYVINPDGWGHPEGPLSPADNGNFEFGVDPLTTAFYMEYTDYDGETVFLGYRYAQTELAGELVYDFLSPRSFKRGITEGALESRIPLLTDELFAGPPPVL